MSNLRDFIKQKVKPLFCLQIPAAICKKGKMIYRTCEILVKNACNVPYKLNIIRKRVNILLKILK